MSSALQYGMRTELQHYLENSKYADFTIKCNARKWKVHKIILACQSRYFKKLFDSDFKEARENEVEFSDEDDDPEVVSAMIQFAYKQQYDKPTKVNESMPFTVKLFIMADKREFPSLMAYTVLEMQALARGIVQGPIGIPEDNAFSRTVKLIYSATNDTEKYAKMLRQIAVEYAYKNNAALEDKDSGYTDVKNHADCFGNDLFEYSGEYSTTK